MMNVKGKTALVTGASSGIGEHFARQLAEGGANLVLTARRTDRLEALASELRERHGVAVSVVGADLSERAAPERLFEATEGAGQPIEILINNAGFGTHDRFVDIPLEVTLPQIQLNITSLTEMTWRFARAMRARKTGYILNVASIGAYLPTPFYAAYAAGKAYVRNFTEAVAFELQGDGVRVCCLCPGATETEFMEVAGHALASWQKKFLMSAERCARIGLRALFGGRRNIVSGWLNAIMMFATRLVPRSAATWIAANLMGR